MTNTLTPKDLIFAEEALIADVQFAVHNLLESKGVTRAALARMLNLSEARISQLFKDSPKNLTLRTVARIFRALGEDARITSETLDRLMQAETNPHDSQRDPYRIMLASMTDDARVRRPYVEDQTCNDNFVEPDFAAYA